MMTRRDLLQSAGVLIVGFSFGGRASAQLGKSLDPN
jgi:hypothetical protein